MGRRGGNRSAENAVLGGAYLAGGAGSGVICLPGDDSFTCQLKRVVASTKGVVFLMGLLYFIWYIYNNRKTIF